MGKQVQGKTYVTLYLTHEVALYLRKEMYKKKLTMSEIADQRLEYSYAKKFSPEKKEKKKVARIRKERS